MKQDEFTPLPREFGSGAPEFAPPGPEFDGHAPRYSAGRRKKRLLLAAAAVLLLALLILPEAAPAPPDPVPTVPVPTDAPPAPSETAPAPQETDPAPTETAPPETEPPGPPTCRAVFFAFSDALRAELVFTHTDAILSVRAELWDSLGDTLEQTWEVPPEAIAEGAYTLPDMMGMYDMYMAHHDAYDPADPFPVPALRVIMTYLDGGEEITEEMTQSYSEEQGWGVRAAEGQLRFRTYEAQAPITLYAGDETWDPETLRSGEILVVVQINGETVPPDQCDITQDELALPVGDGIVYYYANLTTPLQGESGEVLVTVFQRLEGYDTVWSESVRLDY